MSYSFQHTGLLPPWLNLFLGSLFFKNVIVGEIVFFICLLGSFLLADTKVAGFGVDLVSCNSNELFY